MLERLKNEELRELLLCGTLYKQEELQKQLRTIDPLDVDQRARIICKLNEMTELSFQVFVQDYTVNIVPEEVQYDLPR